MKRIQPEINKKLGNRTKNHPDDGRDVNLSNWRTAPFNQWAFRNIDALIPCVAIPNDADNVLPLSSTTVCLDDFHIGAVGNQELGLTAFLQATNTDGFVVMHEDRLIHEYYDNGLTDRKPHILMSVTKSIVGLVAGILDRSGALDVGRLISDIVPEIAGTAYQGATIQNLLDMRTGVGFDETQLARYRVAANWDPIPKGEAPSTLHAFFQSMKAASKPHGGSFAYISPNTDLLGWVIERATGQRFAGLASDLLWKPMGAEEAAYITVDSEGTPRCTGGFGATVRDLARIGHLIASDGYRGSLAVIPTTWIDDIVTGGDPEAWRTGEFGSSFPGMHMRYRNGWYVVDDEPKMLFAMGVYGQQLFIDRANKIVIAKVSSQAASYDARAMWLTLKAVKSIRLCLIGVRQS